MMRKLVTFFGILLLLLAAGPSASVSAQEATPVIETPTPDPATPTTGTPEPIVGMLAVGDGLSITQKNISVNYGANGKIDIGDVVTISWYVRNDSTDDWSGGGLSLIEEYPGVTWVNGPNFTVGPGPGAFSALLTATVPLSEDMIDGSNTVYCTTIAVDGTPLSQPQASRCSPMRLPRQGATDHIGIVGDKQGTLDVGLDGVASVGDTITYTLSLTNGFTETINTQVRDERLAPAYIPFAYIAPGDSHSMTLAYTLTQEDVDRGSVLNCALFFFRSATYTNGTSTQACNLLNLAQEPTPTVTPVTPTPTVTPVTPTVTPVTPTPTVTPVTPAVTPTVPVTPNVTPEVTPTVTPVTPEVTSTVPVTPNVTPEVTPSETPTETPVVTSTVPVTPDVTPDVTPTEPVETFAETPASTPTDSTTNVSVTTPASSAPGSTPVAALPSTGSNGPGSMNPATLAAGALVLTSVIAGACVFRIRQSRIL